MKKVILYVATVCSALCMNSCSDYLDKNPLNSPSDQTFLATETEMQMALASCYTALWTDFETIEVREERILLSFRRCLFPSG